MQQIIVALMALVVVGFLGLVVTEPRATTKSRPRLRAIAASFWTVIMIAGWAGVAYLTWGLSGGLAVAWAWVLTQPPVMQIAMWVLLLPWMITVAVWNTPWPIYFRQGLIVVTFLLSAASAVQQLTRQGK